MMIFDLVGDYRNLESTVSLANLWGFGGEVFCEKCTFPQRIVDFLVVEETTRQRNHQFWEGQVSWSNLLHLTQKLEHVYSGILKDDMCANFSAIIPALPKKLIYESLRKWVQIVISCDISHIFPHHYVDPGLVHLRFKTALGAPEKAFHFLLWKLVAEPTDPFRGRSVEVDRQRFFKMYSRPHTSFGPSKCSGLGREIPLFQPQIQIGKLLFFGHRYMVILQFWHVLGCLCCRSG